MVLFPIFRSKYAILIIFLTLTLAMISDVNSIDSSFSEWPHQRIFDGDLGFGNWIAGRSYGLDGLKLIDNIQRRAIVDGYFIPTRFPNKVHIFSAAEARNCLKGKTIIVTGDSYMKQMFIGLADIILGDPANSEIVGGRKREAVLLDRQRRMKEIEKSLRLYASWGYEKCLHLDISCLLTSFQEDIVKLTKADAIVVNVLVHHVDLHSKDPDLIEKYIKTLESFFSSTPLKITWCLGPKYDFMKVPEAFKNITLTRPTDKMNRAVLDMRPLIHNRIPILDFSTLTGRCQWSNCSVDGGHRARFVNRMKAQILLNNLCEINTIVQ
eukprot:gene14679-31211_t